jgi:thiamine biosynthesis lipoprotein
MISKVEFHAMGSRMLAALECPVEQAGILQQVPVWFAEWEQLFSRFKPDSELNRLNGNNGKPFPVSSQLWEVLKLSLQNVQKSDGLVTPAVLDQLELAGYDRSFEQIQNNAVKKFQIPSDEPCLDEIVMDESTHSVTLPKHLRLDLGGVAKGWAANQAMLRLSEIHPALVNAGGDIAVSGPLSNSNAWPVGVRDPFKPGSDLALLGLKESSVATSGRDYHRWMMNGTWQHHLIDPRTGNPANTDLLTATVIAPNVMAAEMAAKMILILGSERGKEWLEQQTGFEGLLILAEGGTLLPSRGWKEQLWSDK